MKEVYLHKEKKSLPLIMPCKYEGTIKFQVIEETMILLKQFAQQYPGLKVSPIIIAGIYRTGKSYAASRILGSNDAFELGNTTESHTKGIWIGTKMLIKDDQLIIVFDCEGIESVKQVEKSDDTLFLMSTLLSSLFIYNSIGVPNSRDINKMNFIVNIAKNLQVKKGNKVSTFGEFKSFFPCFVWLVRDAHLQPVDKQQKSCTPTEYLTQIVLGQEELDEFSDEESEIEKMKRNTTKKAILNFFQNYECFFIPPPTSSEQVLKRLNTVKDEELNPNFVKEMNRFSEKILKDVRKKNSFDKDNSSPIGLFLYCELIEIVVQAVNVEGSIPALDSMWESSVKIVTSQTIDSLCKKYEEDLKKFCQNQKKPVSQKVILDEHDLIVKELTKDICSKLSFANKEMIKKIIAEWGKKLMDEQNGLIKGGIIFNYILENEKKSEIFILNEIHKLWSPIEHKIKNKSTNNYNFDNFLKEVGAMQQIYDQEILNKDLPKAAILKKELLQKISQHKQFLEQLEGYNQKLIEEKEKLFKASLENEKKVQEIDKLNQVLEQEKRNSQNQLKVIEQKATEEMKQLKLNFEQQRKDEQIRYEKLVESNFKENAETQKKFIEQMQKNNESSQQTMLNFMQQSKQENAELMKLITEKMNQPPVIIESSDGFCTIF